VHDNGIAPAPAGDEKGWVGALSIAGYQTSFL
jgi:hypothetical protein